MHDINPHTYIHTYIDAGAADRLGMTPAAATRLEMIGLLCVMDRTHSQLIDAIPETSGVSHHDKDYESVIQQVQLVLRLWLEDC